jgi:Bacterial pre-peptidase C-terminal domain
MLNNSFGKAIATRKSDNNQNGARPIGQLSGSRVFRGSVGIRDKVDFYSFTLSGRSSFNLALDKLQNNVNVELIQGKKTLFKSAKGGRKSEAIDATLEAGTYFIRISQKSGSSKYRLDLKAKAIPIISPEEGTFNNPINLGLLSGGTVTRTQDTVLTTSSRYYKFQLAGISDVNLALSRVSDSAIMQLYYDFNGNGLADSDEAFETGSASSSSSSPISEALPATGTYFIKVDSRSVVPSARTTYDLTLATTLTPGNIPTDPGSDVSTAYRIGTLTPGYQIELRDYVGKLDSVDFYRFTVSPNLTGSINILGVDSGEGSLQSSLYCDRNFNGVIDDGERIAVLTRFDTASLESQFTYYLEVRQTQAENASYKITLTA